ncbi:beta-ketoacyl-[acyl-carrier-protein] synthase II [Acidocella aquatica]|uniref:Beta-ketoacyl-[acyl-carrier-protein] synthase II n=1 Tax=Acidocella aquatica TaxID=1922313 RepID=A0ABQ6A3B5_9PROT|nr:beta-ketoacyl-[acyl-carrier-protein] synthase family protein [Acidocella aquatica]GLR66122.1 beta-ketoacyl-[acyl-carrier-protein] synthase II [Acidocella aquatica]
MSGPLALSNFSIVTSLGAGREQTMAALREGRSALAPCAFDSIPFQTYAGEITGLDDTPLQPGLAGFDCRNNRLAALALRQDGFLDTVAAARERYGAGRIGVFAGTSTSGILQTEGAYRLRDPASGILPPGFDYARTHNTYSLARFVREMLGLAGPAFTVSTACAATSKVFASAARMIATGICDAAIVGGADTLCATTLFGFHALGVMADEPCRPFDPERRGISLGEAAGFILLERPSERLSADTVLLLGAGESSDAYHMSSPHPEGSGARLAMERALNAAGLEPAAIDYINLHGTATLVGDAAEDRAVSDLFGGAVPCSSTKGFTGHTLGASGVAEAIISALAIQHGFLPGSPHTRALDPGFKSRYVLEGHVARIDRVVSNSFGFGGVNCSLILGRSA